MPIQSLVPTNDAKARELLLDKLRHATRSGRPLQDWAPFGQTALDGLVNLARWIVLNLDKTTYIRIMTYAHNRNPMGTTLKLPPEMVQARTRRLRANGIKRAYRHRLGTARLSAGLWCRCCGRDGPELKYRALITPGRLDERFRDAVQQSLQAVKDYFASNPNPRPVLFCLDCWTSWREGAQIDLCRHEWDLSTCIPDWTQAFPYSERPSP